MSSEPVIDVAGLGKSYHMYPAPHDRLKQAIMPRLHRIAAPIASLAGRTLAPPTYFKPFWALRDISFQVGAGETFGVIGPNGAGKSTLLQLICGTLNPTTGYARVRGRVAAMLELGSGFNPEFTGAENILHNGIILGLTKEQVEARFDDIVAFADIGDFIDQPVKTYSSGMAMRLAFAVIAHVDADVLIIDEALAVGDAYFQQKCMRWLRRFRERGTVLFCGHDIAAVTNFCRQAIWLDHGKPRAIGPAKDVCEAYLAAIYARSTGLADATLKPAASNDAQPMQAPKNDLSQIVEVLEFNQDSASFGTGDAAIVDVRMSDAKGGELGVIKGGEAVQVVVRVEIKQPIENPIVGFFVKDRLGQPLFGDNSFIEYRHSHLHAGDGETLTARFSFELPFLRTGEYSITAAVASGTLENHVQHHWLHDAMIFKVYSPFQNGVMIALPMRSIELAVQPSVELQQA